jgi:SlyX protein
MEHEERFIELEIKLAHQEDLVDSLNQTVYDQARRIDQLEKMLHKLADHVRNNTHTGPGTILNEKPPHY